MNQTANILTAFAASTLVAIPAKAQSVAEIKQVIANVASIEAQGAACDRSDVPLARATLEAEKQWASALLTSVGGTLGAGEIKPATISPCNSPADQQAQMALGDMRFSWIARTAMFARISALGGWSSQLVSMGGAGTTVERLFRTEAQNLVGKFGQAEVQGFTTRLGKESEAEAAYACALRPKTAKDMDRGCPAIPGATPSQSKLALRRLELVEGFAAAIAALPPAPSQQQVAAPAAPPPPPAPVKRRFALTEFGEHMDHFQSALSGSPTKVICAAGRIVAEADPDVSEWVEVTLPLAVIGQGPIGSKVVGKIELGTLKVTSVVGKTPEADRVAFNASAGMAMIECAD